MSLLTLNEASQIIMGNYNSLIYHGEDYRIVDKHLYVSRLFVENPWSGFENNGLRRERYRKNP
ncbi:hypothetical protein KEJ25_08080 [Candidatus Bathyarchaeota archaeon]|nr:hypothetical protein [Candidatus Bathyarchaeota archaeon]